MEELLTTVGTGEAVVTVLNAKGAPTPPVACHLIAPSASMVPLPDEELARRVAISPQVKRYATALDRESAREKLEQRMADDAKRAPVGVEDDSGVPSRPKRAGKPVPTGLEKILKTRTASNMGTQIVRSAMGVLERYLRRR